MSELNTSLPDKPTGWSLANEGYVKVTRLDYYGQPYEEWQPIDRRSDLGALWRKWRSGQVWEGSGRMDEGRQQDLITIENERL